MRELVKNEVALVAAGALDHHITVGAVSVAGGTMLGAVSGGILALNTLSNVTNIWQLALFPIWLAAGAGVGGMIGCLVGIGIGFSSYAIEVTFFESNEF